jgi:hypothetical protein
MKSLSCALSSRRARSLFHGIMLIVRSGARFYNLWFCWRFRPSAFDLGKKYGD